jgi:murein DD-endopeptidase MepM/ murein hydrolase activator NlpD
MPPTDTPRGIRNKNYLNVKNTDDRWMDAGGRTSGTDDEGHAVFADAAYGVRAGILQLRSYFFKHNRRTIAEILARWAPESDTLGSLPGMPPNSPAKYSAFVAERMGIDFNRKLDIFNEDKSVGNIARLRDLFFAMAAYENRGFEVPVEDFNAGLELVQPGVTTAGTGGGSVTPITPDTEPGVAAGDLVWRIGGSVGRRDKNPANAEADIETIQEMLRLAAMILREPRIDPGPVDGKIGENAQTSGTVKAIEAFQSRFMAAPDGVIDVGGRTWRELAAVIEVGEDGEPPVPETGDRPEFVFPLAEVPRWNWTESPRSFGSGRKGGRLHAACDLYAPKGTIIYAIADGTVVRGAEWFYSETYAMEIDHGKYIARYGEIQREAFVRKGERVKAGQPIARVGHLVGITVPSDMLHFELYDKTASGRLTTDAAHSRKGPGGRVFLRRKDLIDPTRLLEEWKKNLPGSLNAAREEEAARPAGGIPSSGFCVHVKRLRQETRASAGHARTVAEYQCYWNGSPLDGLKGHLVERGGPGDNTTEIGDNRDLRIRAGAYRLAVHSGSHYRTYGYKDRDISYTNRPNPGLLLQDTDERTWILIHPGEDYVKSIGCLNPTSELTDADSPIAFADSHSRVISIIEALKSKLGSRFPTAGRIPDSTVFIEGEPA